MLALKIADKYVDLPNDFSFTMNLKSPVFGEVGSYSYPFRIPATARNAVILGFRHRIENTTDPYLTNDGTFYWNGLNLFQGTVKLKTVNSKVYEGSVFEGSGDFYYRQKTLSLQQIDFGKLEFASEMDRQEYINESKEKYYPTQNIAFPEIRDALYFDPPTEDDEQLFFNYYRDGGIHLTTLGLSNRTIIVPMLFLRYVLSKVFEKIGYLLEDTFFTSNTDFNNCLVFNTVDCNQGLTGFFQYPLDKFLFNYHVPQMSINDFILSLETLFNIRFFPNNKTKTVRIISLEDAIKSTEYSSLIGKVISFNTEIEEEILGCKFEMELDSDDTTINDIKVYDESLLAYFKESVQSISDLPLWPGSSELEIRYVKDEHEFYRMISGSWAVFDINTLFTRTKFIYKSIGDTTISTKLCPLLERLQEPGEYVEVGNTQASWKSIPLRLFFLEAQYELGSFYAMRGKSYTANTNLLYNGNNGIFNKYFKSFIDFKMSTKLVKITAQLSYMELANFDFSQKYMINGIKYMVKNIQVTIRKDRILPALLECYVCP